jgi:hypothetical protein
MCNTYLAVHHVQPELDETGLLVGLPTGVSIFVPKLGDPINEQEGVL